MYRYFCVIAALITTCVSSASAQGLQQVQDFDLNGDQSQIIEAGAPSVIVGPASNGTCPTIGFGGSNKEGGVGFSIPIFGKCTEARNQGMGLDNAIKFDQLGPDGVAYAAMNGDLAAYKIGLQRGYIVKPVASPRLRTVSEVGPSAVSTRSVSAGPDEIIVTDSGAFTRQFGAGSLAHLCSIGEFYSGVMYRPGRGVCPDKQVTVATRTAPAVTLQKRPWTPPHGIVRLSGGVACQWNQGTLTGVIPGSMTNAQASRACAENARAS